ncbi:hypothetical protein K435DRAFT_871199 [Dendrothele bispora CBS 962.96]|uniref:Uncharacterized protein n=1 Tax=Dendrothele bispora (strain CBS 962.96) TaxID=1314807 RepID=A0A4S8L4R5_DENBC|nr:hypothetical protein K435DRAFT_871199 [Dendrothele bispora CBS 962.96]
MSLYTLNQTRMTRFQCLLSLFLQRSLQLPLSLDLHISLSTDAVDNYWHATVGKILRPLYYRCRSLKLIGNQLELPTNVEFMQPATELPFVESLVTDAMTLMKRSPTLPAIHQAPCLRHLSLCPASLENRIGISPPKWFPWEQITHTVRRVT